MPPDPLQPPALPARDLEQLLLGLGELYDGVLDPGAWAAATARFGRFFGGAATLLAQDSRSRQACVFSTSGFDPGFIENYIAHFVAVDTWIPALALAPVSAIVTGEDIADRDSFERSEWYNDWLRPQGLYQGTAAILAKTGDVMTEFSVIRPRSRGDMPPDRLALLRLLVPHLQRAVRVHRELRQKDAGMNAALHGLACLDSAAFVTDEKARVVFLNSIAEELLRSSRTLRLGRDRVLTATNPALTNQLHAFVAGAAATACLSATQPGGMIALPRAEGRPLIALVSPFRTETAGLASPSAGALVLVRDPDRTTGPDPAALQTLFGMTSAEARTAIALTAGDTLAGIADARGVSLETVRTQAKRAMEKADVRRQAELVALVLSVPGAGPAAPL